MATQTIRVRRKGQMTLPADVREYLQLEEGDILTVRKEDGKVILESQLQRLRRAQSEVAKYFVGKTPLEPAAIREIAAQAIADEGVETLRQIERDRLEA